MSEENQFIEDVEPQPYIQKVKAEKKHTSIRVLENQPPLKLQEPDLDSPGPWIEYTGIATLRIMDEEAWRSAGVNSNKYIEWNYLNHMRVPMSQFTEAELSYLLGRDGRFIKVT